MRLKSRNHLVVVVVQTSFQHHTSTSRCHFATDHRGTHQQVSLFTLHHRPPSSSRPSPLLLTRPPPPHPTPTSPRLVALPFPLPLPVLSPRIPALPLHGWTIVLAVTVLISPGHQTIKTSLLQSLTSRTRGRGIQGVLSVRSRLVKDMQVQGRTTINW